MLRSSQCILCLNIITEPLDRTGAVIQSTLSEDQSTAHASALSELTGKASNVVGMLNQNEEDGDDELTFLRLRSKQREVMVSNSCVTSRKF
jgi:hypothetical protein